MSSVKLVKVRNSGLRKTTTCNMIRWSITKTATHLARSPAASAKHGCFCFAASAPRHARILLRDPGRVGALCVCLGFVLGRHIDEY